MWTIRVERDNILLAEHQVRNSYCETNGISRTDSEERVDGVAVQNGAFFVSLINKKFMYPIDAEALQGYHGGLNDSGKSRILVIEKDSTTNRHFFTGITPYYDDVLKTVDYTPVIFTQGPHSTRELFFIGHSNVEEG